MKLFITLIFLNMLCSYVSVFIYAEIMIFNNHYAAVPAPLNDPCLYYHVAEGESCFILFVVSLNMLVISFINVWINVHNLIAF
jgi:hypothetical protein